MTQAEKDQLEIERTEAKLKVALLTLILLNVPRKEQPRYLVPIISTMNKNLSKELIDREKIVENVVKSVEEALDDFVLPLTDPLQFNKGKPNVVEYKRKVNKAVDGLDKWKLTVSEKGKRPITIWQKIELDIRHKEQMEKLEQAYKSGEDLFWLSSHVDASKRCEPFQGKLVSLRLPSINNAKQTGIKISGYPIYSFKDITNVVDKYGYKNNIIVGFNCRHYLISFKDNPYPPLNFGSELVEKGRIALLEKRRMERAIRKLKIKMRLFSTANEKQKYIRTKNKVVSLTNKYVKFCKDNNLEVEKWRLKI